jgi:hypothetical protein
MARKTSIWSFKFFFHIPFKFLYYSSKLYFYNLMVIVLFILSFKFNTWLHIIYIFSSWQLTRRKARRFSFFGHKAFEELFLMILILDWTKQEKLQMNLDLRWWSLLEALALSIQGKSFCIKKSTGSCCSSKVIKITGLLFST